MSIELLKPVFEQHDTIMDEKVTVKEMKTVNKPEDDIFEVEDRSIMCSKCLKIVLLEDTFNMHREIGKKMCPFCTITMVSQCG